jgi:hypothetical protein
MRNYIAFIAILKSKIKTMFIAHIHFFIKFDFIKNFMNFIILVSELSKLDVYIIILIIIGFISLS